MRIKDDRLRELFCQESNEHLQTLEEGLLRLEANPNDSSLLPELFRAAHSLKGAAGAVRATNAEALMHRFEDVLGRAHRGTLILNPETVDRFYQALDAVRAFCDEAVTGQPAELNLDQIVRQLDAAAAELEAAEDQPSAASVAQPDDARQPAGLPADSAGETRLLLIADSELRNLFKLEANEHIACLERGLLQLEQNPQDGDRLDEVFRAAHSLKGAARMVSVSKVEAVAHLFEEALGAARKGSTGLTAAMADRLYAAVDSLREFCDEAVTGHPVITDLDTVLARLCDSHGTVVADSESPVPQSPSPTGTGLAVPRVAPAPAAGALAAPQPAPAFNIDTIRVASSKLDALLSQAGELSVTRGRIAHRVTQVEQLLTVWEHWNRDSYGVRSLPSDAARALSRRELEHLLEYVRGDQERMEQIGRLLKALESAVQGDDARVDLLASQLEDGIRSARMLPLSTVFNSFPRLVRDLARGEGKQVEFVIHGGQTTADKRILEEVKDPLTHMIRNAVDHGIELPSQRQANGKPPQATLVLSANQRGANVVIEIQDDGAGIDVHAVRQAALRRRVASEEELAELTETQIQHLIFVPGFSTRSIVTDISGRGVGMDVVRANIERLRGTIEVNSVMGQGTTFRLVLPLTVATRRVLLVAVGKAKYALPVEYVKTNRLVTREDLFSMQGRGTILLDGEPVPVVKLSEILQLPAEEDAFAVESRSTARRVFECIILRVDGKQFGFLVDELLQEREVVVKPHGAILRRVRNVAGSTILDNGEVCITLNPVDLVRTVQASPLVGKAESTLDREVRKKVILLVEDSLVTRTQEKRILETAGFEVLTAVDGQDAYDKLMSTACDAVVSDVEMPNLSGLDLTAKIRSQEQHRDLPVILVTSLASDEDRQRGMDVGADAYLTKPAFDQTKFLETVKRLV